MACAMGNWFTGSTGVGWLGHCDRVCETREMGQTRLVVVCHTQCFVHGGIAMLRFSNTDHLAKQRNVSILTFRHFENEVNQGSAGSNHQRVFLLLLCRLLLPQARRSAGQGEAVSSTAWCIRCSSATSKVPSEPAQSTVRARAQRHNVSRAWRRESAEIAPATSNQQPSAKTPTTSSRRRRRFLRETGSPTRGTSRSPLETDSSRFVLSFASGVWRLPSVVGEKRGVGDEKACNAPPHQDSTGYQQ